jgi:hypothetical protein
MREIIGLAGITLVGFGTGVWIASWKVGICAGLIVLGGGLFIDAIRK